MNKKITAFVIIACMLAAVAVCFAGCSANRAITIRIAAPGEYMDPDTYNGFADWYAEKYGKEVIVEYNEFDTLENLYTWISIKKEDYDLICPSDYMIEKMAREDMLEKIEMPADGFYNHRRRPAL